MGSDTEITLQPRVVRVGQAPRYLGMCKDEFARAIRPFLTEVKIGTQGKGFDRVELDLAWEHYKAQNGRPPMRHLPDEPKQDTPTSASSPRKPKGTTSSHTPAANTFSDLLGIAKAKNGQNPPSHLD